MSERIEAIAKRLGVDHGDTFRARFIRHCTPSYDNNEGDSEGIQFE